MHDPVLALHVVAGTAALVVGLLAMPGLPRGSERPRALLAYQVAVAVVTSTAIVLAALDWSRFWYLAAIAVAVQAAALGGLRLSPSSAPARAWRVRLICGTYVGLVTALLVVSWGSPLAWILPAVIGAPLVERAASIAGRDTTSRLSERADRL